MRRACAGQTFPPDRFFFLGPNELGAGFLYRFNWVPNGVSTEHFRSDRISLRTFIVRWTRGVTVREGEPRR